MSQSAPLSLGAVLPDDDELLEDDDVEDDELDDDDEDELFVPDELVDDDEDALLLPLLELELLSSSPLHAAWNPANAISAPHATKYPVFEVFMASNLCFRG